MPRHQWTKNDIRKVFKTCQDNVGKKDRLQILQLDFPDCSIGALKFLPLAIYHTAAIASNVVTIF